MQGMSKNTRTVVALSCLGIYPLESYIDKRKLLFLGQLCRTDTSMRICVLFLQRLTKYLNNPSTTFGFVPDLYRLVGKYNLKNFPTRTPVPPHSPIMQHGDGTSIKPHMPTLRTITLRTQTVKVG